MKKISLLLAISAFILFSCGESEDVKNCKIHYCDLIKLNERLEKGEDVKAQIDEKTMLLESTKETAIETGHSDIEEILKNCDCK